MSQLQPTILIATNTSPVKMAPGEAVLTYTLTLHAASAAAAATAAAAGA
jgi:hypothetical protein